jgi:hypothetical protein
MIIAVPFLPRELLHRFFLDPRYQSKLYFGMSRWNRMDTAALSVRSTELHFFSQNPLASVSYSGHVAAATVARISPSGYYCASADTSGTGMSINNTQHLHI